MLDAVRPGVVLVEEAGEILESHILTALGPETKQLVLIGDHKQLRPRVNFALSVEKGDGYDLNKSLFERLVERGYPHHTLLQQHRMRPELANFVRELTYPDLFDASSTQNRPSIKGLQDNIVFLNHTHMEEQMQNVRDWKDDTSPSTKRNLYEIRMAINMGTEHHHFRLDQHDVYLNHHALQVPPSTGARRHHHSSTGCRPSTSSSCNPGGYTRTSLVRTRPEGLEA